MGMYTSLRFRASLTPKALRTFKQHGACPAEWPEHKLPGAAQDHSWGGGRAGFIAGCVEEFDGEAWWEVDCDPPTTQPLAPLIILTTPTLTPTLEKRRAQKLRA